MNLVFVFNLPVQVVSLYAYLLNPQNYTLLAMSEGL